MSLSSKKPHTTVANINGKTKRNKRVSKLVVAKNPIGQFSHDLAKKVTTKQKS